MLAQIISGLQARTRDVADALRHAGLEPDIEQHLDRLDAEFRPRAETFQQMGMQFVHLAEAQVEMLLGVIHTPGGEDGLFEKAKMLLKAIQARLEGLSLSDHAMFCEMIEQRDRLVEDERRIARQLEELRRKMESLVAELRANMEDLRRQQMRVIALRCIPFAWAIAELANLVSSGKLMEQQIAGKQRGLHDIDENLRRMDESRARMSGLTGMLHDLETGTHNVMNSLGFIAGDLEQILDTLVSGEAAQWKILLEAYLATLKLQLETLRASLD